jgi:putative ABC transport system permease protein
MTWLQLSLKEWRRRPLRTSVTCAGVGIAAAALFSLLAFQQGYREGVRQELDHLGAHILLVPKGCPYDAASMALHGATWPCYLKQSYLAEVRTVPEVATAAPVFMTALYDAASEQAVYVGVESNILSLRPSWRIHGSFPRNDGDLLVGSVVAQRYAWRLGQQVQLPGLKKQYGMITGVLSPTQGGEDTFIHLRLDDAQRRFKHPQELTHILVRLSDPNGLDKAVAQLRGCDAGLAMNVVPLAHVFRTIQSLVNSTRLLLGCIAAVAFLVAGAGLSNTILIAVAERQRELGMMRAIGASRADIFRLVWLETLQTCFGGAVLGMAVAFLASRGLDAWVRSVLPFAPSGPVIHWEWWIAAVCTGGALILGSLAGLLPASRAAAVPPMITIRGSGGWS